MKEDIKRCEELIKESHSCWIGITNQKAIENLLKRYKELKADNYECNNIISEQIDIIKNSIPISVIQNKIKATEKEIDDLMENGDVYNDNVSTYNDLKLKIEVLQELLEERR